MEESQCVNAMVLNQARKAVLSMNDYCAFSKDHRCIKWMDYELTLQELEEADEMCHGNWIEIQHLRDRVTLLEELLQKAGIDFPSEH